MDKTIIGIDVSYKDLDYAFSNSTQTGKVLNQTTALQKWIGQLQ